MITQAWFDLRILLRNGEQLLLTIVIPVALLIGVTLIPAIPLTAPAGAGRLPEALGGVITVAIIASAFTSLAIGVGFDRRSGALVMLATTPLSRVSILGARVITALIVTALQVTLLCATATVLGWRPEWSAMALAPIALVGTGCFAALGFALGGAVRAEATLAIANAVFLVLVVAGGATFPATVLPDAVQPVVSVLPSSALGDLLRWSTGYPDANGLAIDGALLAIWGLVGTLVARRTFAWR
ncbi:MAG: ABC transporter permease [Candidatus Nanopelagicales bacterium]